MTGNYPGIFIGLLFGGLNLWLLGRIISGIVNAEKVSVRKTAFLFGAKMILLFVTIGLLLWGGYVTPLPFLGGFTVSLIAGILLIIKFPSFVRRGEGR